MLNQLQIIGRLTRDSEFSFVAHGQGLCKFSLAVNDHWKDRDGRKHERVEFFECTIWGERGEKVSPLLKKGALIFAQGKMQSNKFQAKDGTEKQAWTLKVDNFDILVWPPKNDEHDQRLDDEDRAGPAEDDVKW